MNAKDFQGVNEGFLLELYERFLTDPTAVDAEAREFFRTWSPTESPAAQATLTSDGLDPRVVAGAVSLAESIRRYGHLAAAIDPLGRRPVGDPTLLPETHGVTPEDLKRLPASLLPPPVPQGAETMWDVCERLRAIYCGTTGFDIAHIFVSAERQWLRHAIEAGRYRAPADPIDPIALLDGRTDEEQARMLEVAYDYLNYRILRSREPLPELEKRAQQLLVLRSKVPSISM